MLAALFFLMAVIGVAFSLVVLRADAKRWDNRVFAAMTLLDAATTSYRGLALVGGGSLTDLAVQHNCAASAFVMVWLSIEFAYSFPMSEPAPAKVRVPLVTIVATALVLDRLPATRHFVLHYAEYFIFIPAFLVIIGLFARNFRRATGDRSGIVIVMFAFIFRWTIPVINFSIV